MSVPHLRSTSADITHKNICCVNLVKEFLHAGAAREQGRKQRLGRPVHVGARRLDERIRFVDTCNCAINYTKHPFDIR